MVWVGGSEGREDAVKAGLPGLPESERRSILSEIDSLRRWEKVNLRGMRKVEGEQRRNSRKERYNDKRDSIVGDQSTYRRRERAYPLRRRVRKAVRRPGGAGRSWLPRRMVSLSVLVVMCWEVMKAV